MYEEAAASAADLTLIEEDAIDNTFNRLVERRIFKDDVGRLATELQREALPCPAIPLAIVTPTEVLPVKATFATRGSVTIDMPVLPGPVTMLTTPSGSSAWRQTSAKRSAVSGVVEAGFRTTVLPAARAGAIFHANMRRGKFHGITCPTTPCASGRRPGTAYSSLSAQPA